MQSTAMARKRRPPAAAAAGHARPSLVAALDEDAQAEVLQAAKASGVLAALASSSKQLCSLARSRVPHKLQITTAEHAELVIRSRASGRPAFSACTELQVELNGLASCLTAAGVWNAAQHWTTLQHLEVSVQLSADSLKANQTLDYCIAGTLGSLPALQQLRRLVLHVPEFGSCSAMQLGQLVQLTHLDLGITEPTAAAAAADLSALAGMSSLVELVLEAPAVQPAAGAAGPFCFPSSLTLLDIKDPRGRRGSPACIPRCLTHLPGCPALQELRLGYSRRQHPSAHPGAVVALLAQHNQQLRKLCVSSGDTRVRWDAHVKELPDAAGPVDGEWRPDACLAALRKLDHLEAGGCMYISNQDDWQHMAQLTGLEFLEKCCILCAPPPLVTCVLSVLSLWHCGVQLGGDDLGRLLLACPCLEQAYVMVVGDRATAAVPAADSRLTPHPRLRGLWLQLGSFWGAAVDHWSALAPVVVGVSDLVLEDWPSSDTIQPRGGLPDLSPCTALTQLQFTLDRHADDPRMRLPEQEHFLAMMAPLGQLRHLEVGHVPRLNARVALVLQHMLPQLSEVIMRVCGSQLPLAPASHSSEREEELLGDVKQLLRPGLQLVVSNACVLER
jgi:hypothetical protein